MLGHNRTRSLEQDPSRLQVNSVFYTLQGEGPFAGRPAVFVRLSGCNLKCWFCDTEWNDDDDPYLDMPQIFAKIEEARPPWCALIVITGGEPMRQKLNIFIELAAAKNLHVQIETSGTIWQDALLSENVTTVLSPKTAKVHSNFYQLNAIWKYVIREGEVDNRDGLPSQPTQRGKKDQSIIGTVPARPPRGAMVYLQPMDEFDDKKNAANLQTVVGTSMSFGYIAGVQLHKIMEID